MNNGINFETQVALALHALDVFSGPNVRMYRNRVYSGAKDPHGYEIDIAIEMNLTEGLCLLLIVECKSHGRPVDRAVVQRLVQVRDDISAHKAMVISPNGFQSGAVRLAKKNRIALWQFVERRFLHVSHHMNGLRNSCSQRAIALNGFEQYLANRGIGLKLSMLSAEELIGKKEGLALYDVGFVWSSHDSENPEVSPPPSNRGLTIYETACISEPDVSFAFQIMELILRSGTDEASVLRAHLRIARDRWTSAPEYASFIDGMCGDSFDDDLSNPFARMRIGNPRTREDEQREKEEKTHMIDAEDAMLRKYLQDRCELK